MDHLPIAVLLGLVEMETAEAAAIPGMMIPDNKCICMPCIIGKKTDLSSLSVLLYNTAMYIQCIYKMEPAALFLGITTVLEYSNLNYKKSRQNQ